MPGGVRILAPGHLPPITVRVLGLGLLLRPRVCLCVLEHISGPTRPILYMLPTAVARSSSGSVAIRYIGCFRICERRHICT